MNCLAGFAGAMIRPWPCYQRRISFRGPAGLWRDPAQGRMLRKWIDHQVMPPFRGRILPVDTAVARRCAELHVPNPQAERDALIAATALVHGFTVATRNVREFAAMGVPLVNPWD